MIDQITIFSLTVLLWLSAAAGSVSAVEKRPPNSLLLLADDLGYGEVEGFSSIPLQIKTPYLTRLQRDGMKFTNFYSGEAVCAPARCTLFTGKHTGHATVRGNRKGPDGYDFPLKSNPQDVTIVQLLKEYANYKTAMVGKWCFGGEKSESSPWKKGFDYFYGHLYQAAAHNMYPRYLWERSPEEDAHKLWFPENYNASRNVCMNPDNSCRYSHSMFVDKALEYLEAQRNNQEEQPFFLFASFTIPHAGGWTGDWDEPGNPVPSDGRYAHETNWPLVERDHAAAITEYLDRDVGRLLQKLEDLGMADNTLVIFTSDNGPHNEGGHDVTFFNSSGPLRGYKRSLYEGGIRVPFLVRWPGHVDPNTFTQDVGWFPDLYTTFAHVAGIRQYIPANSTDGESLLGLWDPMAAPSPPPNRVLYWEFCTSGKWGQAVRQGDWKLVSLDRPHEPWELYNLKDDIGETRNIASENVLLVQKLENEARRAHRDDPKWPTGRSCIPSDSFERSMSFALDFS